MKRLTKLKIKYFLVISCTLVLLGIALPTFMRYNVSVIANAVGYAKETRTSTYKIHFHNNGGTGTMESMTMNYNEVKTLTKILLQMMIIILGVGILKQMESVKVSPTYSVGSTTQVTLNRINKILYASINGGAEQQVIDFNNMTKPFYAPLTFGASLNGNGDPQRYYNGTISNISVQYIE